MFLNFILRMSGEAKDSGKDITQRLNSVRISNFLSEFAAVCVA